MRFFDKFTSGLLIGSVFSFVLAAILDADVAAEMKSAWVQFATIIAVIAGALIALMGPNKQIDQQRREFETIQSNKLNAARSVLSLALAEIHEVAENRAYFEIDADENRKGNSWEISESSIQNIAVCAEYASGEAQSRLMRLLSRYQMLLARCSQVKTQGNCLSLSEAQKNEKLLRLDHFVNWLALQSIAISLFTYARKTDLSLYNIEENTPREILISIVENAPKSGGWLFKNDPDYLKKLEGLKSSEDLFPFAHI